MLINQLEPGYTLEKAKAVLELHDEVMKSIKLTPEAWGLIGPLLNDVKNACHRRIRGDA